MAGTRYIIIIFYIGIRHKGLKVLRFKFRVWVTARYYN